MTRINVISAAAVMTVAMLLPTPSLAQLNGSHTPGDSDVTLPVASKTKLFALVNIRYLWESGAQLKTEGQTLVVTATFPVPSVKLP